MTDLNGIAPVLFALFGVAIGLALRSVIAAASIRAANRKAAAILEEARQQQSTLVIGAKGEISRLRAEAELAQQADREAAAAEAERLRLREVTLGERESFFAGREVAIAERERTLVDESVALDVARANVNTRLAEVAGLDPEAARTEVLSRFTEEAERETKRLRALEAATGVELLIDETPLQVTLSSFDPVRRQVARVALERLMQDGRIHPIRIEEIVAKAQGEVDADSLKNGEAAALKVGVTGIPTELLRILGRLQWRTSFGQNVLLHSIETAQVAGAVAGELGMDIRAAKVGGLLHDIGKALDHEIEGTHAAIGADLARRHGMPEGIVNAIAAHHQEVECTAREAPIVQVADAISAARPGARGDQGEAHLRRLEDLQQIALGFEGVEKVYAVQAGREVRILVRPDQVTDEQARTIAHEVVKRIEEQLAYPGQIRVTVIRETRAVDYAR